MARTFYVKSQKSGSRAAAFPCALRRLNAFKSGLLLLKPGLLLAVAAFIATLPLTASDTAPWGRQVLSIRLDSDAGMDIREFSAQIAQKVSEPLDPARVSESLRNLYATGRFAELRADFQEEKAGVVLIFVARARFFVGVIQVKGNPSDVHPDVLTSASRLRLGQRLSDEALAAARGRLMAVLLENAYYQAQVASELDKHNYEVADVLFSIVPGQPARLSGVLLKGQPLVPPQRLAALAGWKPGRPLTATSLERGLVRIRRFYVKQRRLQAAVSVQSRTPDPSKRTEKLVVDVKAGPVVNVSLRGAKVGASKLRRLIPIYAEGQTDDLALSDGQRNLQDYFEQQGYYSATVKWTRATSANGQRLDIKYTVNLGARGNFVGLTFKGNQHVPADDLEGVIELQPEDFPRVRGAFSHEMLRRSVAAITALYRSRGYLDVSIAPRLDDHYDGEPDHLFVTFNIIEGPRTTVGHLSLEGCDEPTAKKIRSFLVTNPGQPYSPARAKNDQDAILTYLADRGYNHANVIWTATPASAQHQMDVKYRIEPGPQERIQRIVLMGNRHTRTGIIDRQLTMRVNDPLRQSETLESQRRLYDLGVFNQVQIAHEDPETGGAERTVLVNVEEARRWTVGYGFGFDAQRLENSQPQGQYGASPRASLEVTRLDVGGRPQTFSIRGRYSDLEKGGAASYLIPHFLNRPTLDFRLTALDEQTRDVLTFTAQREEGNVILERHSSASTFILARYSYRHVVASSLQISPEEIPLFSQPARVAMVGLTYVNDHRDNPADATKGSYSVLDGGIAWQKFGSQANFLRLSGQNSTYYRLRPHVIFARNTRIGIETPFGGLIKVLVPPSGSQPGQFVLTHDIPLPERFFMGGSESDRGFALNQAGPRDSVTGFPVGGRALFLNSLELRLPVEENKYGFVLFHDAGNVFSSLRRMRLLKVSQNSPTDLDYTVHAVGIGLRYNTPVGPLRFDVGYSLNPPRFQVQPKAGVVEVNRLSNIQFSLSVGQAF